MPVHYSTEGPIAVVTIDRPEVRNAVDRATAAELAAAFRAFDADDALAVAILTGASGTFCAGADLKAVATGGGNRTASEGDGPMGPTRMRLSKPVIAAVEGFAVAGGLELSLWCDMRVAAEDAVFGVYCRRWGVPLVDGGTVRLPRLIGESNAMDMILTGRGSAAKRPRAWASRIASCPGARRSPQRKNLPRRSRTSLSGACAATGFRHWSSGIVTSMRPCATKPGAAVRSSTQARPVRAPHVSPLERDATAPSARRRSGPRAQPSGRRIRLRLADRCTSST